MRFYMKKITDQYEPVANSWFVFDREEKDENGNDLCKESNVSYKDALALCDELNTPAPQQAPLAPATDAPTIPQPLAEKNAEIAALKAENERMKHFIALAASLSKEGFVKLHSEHRVDQALVAFGLIGGALQNAMPELEQLLSESPAAPQLAPTPAQEVTLGDIVTEPAPQNPIRKVGGITGGNV